MRTKELQKLNEEQRAEKNGNKSTTNKGMKNSNIPSVCCIRKTEKYRPKLTITMMKRSIFMRMFVQVFYAWIYLKQCRSVCAIEAASATLVVVVVGAAAAAATKAKICPRDCWLHSTYTILSHIQSAVVGSFAATFSWT